MAFSTAAARALQELLKKPARLLDAPLVHYTKPQNVESLIREGWNPGARRLHTEFAPYGGPETVPLTTPGSRWSETRTNKADIDDWMSWRTTEANKVLDRYPGGPSEKRTKALEAIFSMRPKDQFEPLVPVQAELSPGLRIEHLDSLEALFGAQQRTGAPQYTKWAFPALLDFLKKDQDGVRVSRPWEYPDKRPDKYGRTDWFDMATDLDDADLHLWKPQDVRFTGVLDPKTAALWEALRKPK
jgi:hypothetical protein